MSGLSLYYFPRKSQQYFEVSKRNFNSIILNSIFLNFTTFFQLNFFPEALTFVCVLLLLAILFCFIFVVFVQVSDMRRQSKTMDANFMRPLRATGTCAVLFNNLSALLLCCSMKALSFSILPSFFQPFFFYAD